MSTLAGDFWVCGECRSINNAGAKQCYNCRTPKDRAAVDPETIDPSTHGKLREIELPAFRPSRGVAMLATAGIVAIAIMQAYNTFIVASAYQLQIDGAVIAPNQAEFASAVGILTLGIAALALIGWALWLSRVVTAMPALALGYPAADGFMAFVENFLPGLNLYRVPAIVRDVVHRLEPGTVRGEAVIFGSWLALLGGVLVPRIGAALTGTSLQSGPDALRTAMLVSIVASIFVALGSAGLIALIWWVEGRIERRRRVQLAEAPSSGGTAQAPQFESARQQVEAVVAQSAFAAAGASGTRPTETSPWDVSAPAATARDAARAPAPLFSLPQVEPTPPPDDVLDDAWEQVTARRMQSRQPEPPPNDAAQVEAPNAVPPPAEVPKAAVEEPAPEHPIATASEFPVVEATPEVPVVEAAPEAPATELTAPVEAAAPVEAPAPVEAAVPVEEPAAVEIPDSQHAVAPETEAPMSSPEAGGPPHLKIKVGARGMITAEMDGETEHVILDDLTAYAEALAKVDGTAAIQAATDDTMAGLIARRAQRILDDAGVQVTVD